jgi:type IX secretion system PorP/SprF family membrane protein
MSDLIMKKNLTLLVSTLLSLQLFGQQGPLYSQYMLNPLLINPAYAGFNNNFNAMAGYRIQWTGLEGQPKTLNASAHTTLADNKVGLGILFVNDRIGNISNTETNASATYKLKFKTSVFSFGMRAGVQSYRTDFSELNIYNPDDHAFMSGEQGSQLNIGAGAILASDKFFIGLSVPRLLPTTFDNGGEKIHLHSQHYYLMSAYAHYVSDRIRLKPSLLLRAVKGAPLSADIGANVNIDGIHTAGLFTRNFGTYGLLLQTLLDKTYRFGYVFELPTNRSVGNRFATHEISIGVVFSAFSYHERDHGNF